MVFLDHVHHAAPTAFLINQVKGAPGTNPVDPMGFYPYSGTNL